MNPRIKICGITKKEEAQMLLNYPIDYAGMVLYYPKSKRNNKIENAKKIQKILHASSIKTVAVIVDPTIQQIQEIQEANFDLIQIHGTLTKESLQAIEIPILKAFNVHDIKEYEAASKCDKVCGYVFDAIKPGSGKTFDWSILKTIPRDDKLLVLAGGINKSNIKEAIKKVKPDIIDVSSGVEGENGKDERKIKELIDNMK